MDAEQPKKSGLPWGVIAGVALILVVVGSLLMFFVGRAPAPTEEPLWAKEDEAALTKEEIAPTEEEFAPAEEEIAPAEEEAAPVDEAVLVEEGTAPAREEPAPTEEKIVANSKPKILQIAMVNRPASVQSVVRVAYPVKLKPGAKDGLRLGGGKLSQVNQAVEGNITRDEN